MRGELWFRAKRYGWGWTPAAWQGWAVTAVYLVVVVGWAVYLALRLDATIGWHTGKQAWLSALPILLFTALFVMVCRIKGERPRWRWGK